MTRESLSTLNTETLIGFTDDRGTAWHYREKLQGDEPNHYPGPIPVADVRRRLFHWTALTSSERWDVPAELDTATGWDTDGCPIRTVTGADLVLWRSDRPEVKLGTVSPDYGIHQYAATLLDTLAAVITPDGLAVTNDSLSIGSAGLLRGGRQAWVQIEHPDTVDTADGVGFRPYILAATSHDQSLKSTFATGVTIVVCDNTLAAALGEADHHGRRIKFVHTKHNHPLDRIGDTRRALGILERSAEKFIEQVTDLCSIPVTDPQFDRFLKIILPPASQHPATRTRNAKLHDQLTDLYNNDPRVSPWRGTAFGALQMVNTHRLHLAPIHKHTYRPARNMDALLSGNTHRDDAKTLEALDTALTTV